MSKFKLKYEVSENVKTGRVNTVAFNLHRIKQMNFFGTSGILNPTEKRPCNGGGRITAKTKTSSAFRKTVC